MRPLPQGRLPVWRERGERGPLPRVILWAAGGRACCLTGPVLLGSLAPAGMAPRLPGSWLGSSACLPPRGSRLS